MLKLWQNENVSRNEGVKLMFKGKKIVIFGAHPDDTELGMGGTLNQIKDEDVKIVVFADTAKYNGEEIRQEFRDSMNSLLLSYDLHSFEVDNLAKELVDIRRLIYEYKDADIFFAPSLNSTHQDHRTIGQAVSDIMLEKTIFYYEEIRGGINQRINCWNEITAMDLSAKYRLMDFYETQKKRHYTTDDAIGTMARFRGGQIKTNYAEGFEVKRLVL